MAMQSTREIFKMTNKSILSAANIFLATYNNDKLAPQEKYDIFGVIKIMSDVAEDCIIEDKTKEHHKQKILEVIDVANSVLD